MDSQERDALREKHRDWSGHCPACDYQSHPCDVIKMLDYVELLEQAYEHARAMGARMTVLFAQSLDKLKVVTT